MAWSCCSTALLQDYATITNAFTQQVPNCSALFKQRSYLTPTEILMFIAASSAARYLNTYGIATRSIPALLLSQSLHTTLA